MGLILKDKNGRLLTRPVTHPATDLQVYNQLNALIEEGKISSVGGDVTNEQLEALAARVRVLEETVVLFEESSTIESDLQTLVDMIINQLNGEEDEY